MKINLKKEKGFTTIDVSVAMMIAVVFVAIMSSMLYSVYASSTESKRTAMALNYAVDIFERIGAVAYDDVYEEGILRSVQSTNVTGIQSAGTDKGTNAKIGTYEINLKIEDEYNDNTIKLITLTIKYPISAKKTETMELQRIKVKKT